LQSLDLSLFPRIRPNAAQDTTSLAIPSHLDRSLSTICPMETTSVALARAPPSQVSSGELQCHVGALSVPPAICDIPRYAQDPMDGETAAISPPSSVSDQSDASEPQATNSSDILGPSEPIDKGSDPFSLVGQTFDSLEDAIKYCQDHESGRGHCLNRNQIDRFKGMSACPWHIGSIFNSSYGHVSPY
jgi:hypothetical protein